MTTWHSITGLDYNGDRIIRQHTAFIWQSFQNSRLAEIKNIRLFLFCTPFPRQMCHRILCELGWEPTERGVRPISDGYRKAVHDHAAFNSYDIEKDVRRPIGTPSQKQEWPKGLEQEERYFLGLIGVEPRVIEQEILIPVGAESEATGTEDDDYRPF